MKNAFRPHIEKNTSFMWGIPVNDSLSLDQHSSLDKTQELCVQIKRKSVNLFHLDHYQAIVKTTGEWVKIECVESLELIIALSCNVAIV